ncbi:MAG: hypothetical protein ABIP19_08235 [Dermatophilaceae bacterium]
MIDGDLAATNEHFQRYTTMELTTAPPADRGIEAAGLFMQMIDMSTMSALFQTVISQ